eukprot:jgi/Bigna1/133949/aug1.23_g8657
MLASQEHVHPNVFSCLLRTMKPLMRGDLETKRGVHAAAIRCGGGQGNGSRDGSNGILHRKRTDMKSSTTTRTKMTAIPPAAAEEMEFDLIVGGPSATSSSDKNGDSIGSGKDSHNPWIDRGERIWEVVHGQHKGDFWEALQHQLTI